MREDAYGFHARAIDDFLKAFYGGHDTRDEVANMLFSVENMRNHGYARIPLLKEIKTEEQKLDLMQERTGRQEEGQRRAFRREAMVQTARSTKHEASRRGHHRAMKVFDRDMWERAVSNNNENSIDSMVRRALAWRMGTRPNTEEHEQDDITEPHHKVQALGLFNSRIEGHNYGSMPLLQKMVRSLYHEGRADEFHQAMVHEAKQMKPEMRKLFGRWDGNNASVNSFFNLGLEDFKEKYEQHFGDLKDDAHMKTLFMWVKGWENEGLPYSFIFDQALNKNGHIMENAARTLRKAIESSQSIHDAFTGEFHPPSTNRTGIDAYRNGFYMLPREMQRGITKWMLMGADDDQELKRVLGPNFDDAKGFMEIHNRIFNGALRKMYSGNPLGRGYTHQPQNKFTEDGRTQREERETLSDEQVKERLEAGRDLNVDDSIVAHVLANYDLTSLSDMPKVGHGAYPHIKENKMLGGTFFEMSDDVPDLRSFYQAGLFNSPQGQRMFAEITSGIAREFTREAKIDEIHRSMEGMHSTHAFDGEFRPDAVRTRKTAMGILADALGAYGSLGADWDDIGQLRYDAFPGMFFGHLDTRYFIPAYRQKHPKMALKDKYTRLSDPYQKTGDEQMDVQEKLRLKASMRRNGIDDDRQKQMLEMFDAGQKVVVPVTPIQDPMGKTIYDIRQEGDEGSAEDVAEIYTAQMPKARVVHSPSLNGLIGAETSYRPDEDDPSGTLSMDGLRLDHDNVYSHPSSSLGRLRLNAMNKGHDKLLSAHHLEVPNDLKHDQDDPAHRFSIPALLFGFHGDLSKPVSDEELAAFRQGHAHRRHEDPVGLMRPASDIMGDIITDDPLGGGHLALYPLEEYEEYLKTRGTGKYQLPEPITHGIKNFHELLQEVESQDDRKLSRAELKALLDKDGTVAMGNKVSAFGTTNEGEHYVIGQDHKVLAELDRRVVVHAMRNTSDEVQRELLQARAIEISDAAREAGIPPSFEEQETEKMELAHQTHQVSKGIFQHLVRPAIESQFPGIFGKEGMTEEENNAAYEATVYGMHVAEYMAAHMSPQQRARLIENGLVTHGPNAEAKRIREVLTPEQVGEIDRMLVKRKTHDAKMERSLKHLFDGEQTTGQALVEKLVETMPNNQQRNLKVFQDVVEQVQQAAKEQGIHFADAFRARYLPTRRISKKGSFIDPKTGNFRYSMKDDVNGNSRRSYVEGHDEPDRLHDRMAQARHLMVDGGYIKNAKGEIESRGMKINQAAYKGLPGGIYSTHDEIGHVHGGGNTFHENKEPRSIDSEARAIHEVMKYINQMLKFGSDVSVNGPLSERKMRKIGSIFPVTNKAAQLNNDTQLLRFAESLVGETAGRGAGSWEQKTKSSELPFGGDDLNNAHLIPVSTSRPNQYYHGRNCRFPFTVNMSALQSKEPHLHIESAAQARTQHTNQFNVPVSPIAIKDANPVLGPYTGQNIGGLSYYEDEAQRQVTAAPFMTSLDEVLDDSLFLKDDGQPHPVKFMHRIFDLDDMEQLRGFSGDWVVSLYPQGDHLIVTKKGKKLTAHGADGEVKLDKVFSEEVDKVYEKDFVVHAILHDGILTVIDLLKTADEDTHNMPTKDRVRHLRAQYESSEHIKMPEPINTKRSDDEGLRTAIEGLRNEQNIDVLLRDANATYMKGEPRHPKWVLLSKEKMVDVIILSRAGQNYTVGVGPLMHPENYGKRAQQVGEEHYMVVGSAKGPRGLNVGDFATVRCTGVSASKDEYPVYRVRAAKVTDNEPLAADSVETLAILTGDHHVPQQVSMKKGRIVITFPQFDDEVICKTRIEDGAWVVEPQHTTWGNDYLIRLAQDQEPYWSGPAALLLKRGDVPEEEPEYEEVNPEPPAGHSKKRKHILDEEEEVIKRGVEVLERALEHLLKEKVTSTGVQGLGIGYATPDEHPKGPTENINDETLPDFDPAARADDELKPATSKKTKRLRTDRGEEAELRDNGTIEVL